MLIIYNCGGHARSVAEVAIANGEQSIIFIDDNARPNETSLGFPVVATTEAQGNRIMAAGDNNTRAELFNSLPQEAIISIIANDAYLGKQAEIQSGVFIGHGAYLGPNVKIGCNSIINTHCVIEHDCIVGNHTHVSINATLAGKCRIGDFVMIGAGAIVIDNVSIADHVIIGAGAVVTQDITEPGTYVGIPAKKITN